MNDSSKITPFHRQGRQAVVYIRQSTVAQVRNNLESLERQYELTQRAVELGWDQAAVVVIDEDLGRSGADASTRTGFQNLVAAVGLGKVGIILGIEVSRLARRNADWYQLLDLCALTDTLIGDSDGIYHPGDYSDRLVLGLKGTMSEALCGHPHKASYADLAVMPIRGPIGVLALAPASGSVGIITENSRGALSLLP